MLEILLRPEDKVIFTAPLSERAASPAELLQHANIDQKEAIDDAKMALERGKELTQSTKAEDRSAVMICAGSLYLIGFLRKLLI